MKSQDVSNELSSHFHSVHGGWYEEGIRVQLIKLVAKVKVDLFASRQESGCHCQSHDLLKFIIDFNISSGGSSRYPEGTGVPGTQHEGPARAVFSERPESP